jgi:Arm DNA-binding domain
VRKILTDTLIRALMAPETGRLEYADTRSGGLAFRVTAAGVKSWSFRFRDPVSGKPARFSIGQYPEVSLANARERADGLRRAVARERTRSSASAMSARRRPERRSNTLPTAI